MTAQNPILDQTKENLQAKQDRRQFIGFACLIIGAFLGFISCLLSILNPFPALYYYILYGLTSIAASIIGFGLYYVLE